MYEKIYGFIWSIEKLFLTLRKTNNIMALKILRASKYSTKLKATVQASGKLGFTDVTRQALNLTENSYVYIAQDSDSQELFMILIEEPNPDAFRVHKSGKYYNLSTSQLFNELGFKYREITYIFDLIRDSAMDSEAGGVVYKMNRRELNKRKEDEM